MSTADWVGEAIVADTNSTDTSREVAARFGGCLVDFSWSDDFAAGAVRHEERYTSDVLDRRIGVWEDVDGAGPQAPSQRWTVYDGDNPWADFAGDGSLTTRYLYGLAIDQLFARISAAGEVDWYLTDHLGSVWQIVASDGTVQDEITYDSFGQVVRETNPSAGDRFKYTAREWHAALDQYYYRARYYDPGVGRFLGEDPLRFRAGDSNLYRYVFNTPVNATDPSGELVWFVVIGVAVWAAGMGTLKYAESQYNAATAEMAKALCDQDQARIDAYMRRGRIAEVTGITLGVTGIVIVGAGPAWEFLAGGAPAAASEGSSLIGPSMQPASIRLLQAQTLRNNILYQMEHGGLTQTQGQVLLKQLEAEINMILGIN